MKRKAGTQTESKKPQKKRSKHSLSDNEARSRFRNSLFDTSVLDKYTSEYASSSPYKHSVIRDLIDEPLLRKVRDEIRNNVSFTPKETDIYKIHQSGDLANLDGLDDDALGKLPSLLSLRDAMYSEPFRNYVSHITNCGPLSGRKTDMAINVYTPGCYLLCHDDVIGSRKVSYILYLTDPDTPWQAEWGGALRLFPVFDQKGKDGAVAKTPGPDVVKVIPPAWNQLSFFAVQPGKSFHDVEEVYHAETKKQLEKQGGRVRMAISGWFHIPQIGEEGYVEGAEEAQAKNSSLMQLSGDPDQHDQPQAKAVPADKAASFEDFEEADMQFLLKYLSPNYLTPDTLEQVSVHFEDNSSITLPNILGKKFAARLKDYVTKQETEKVPVDSQDIEDKTAWKVARPPHKHRFMYLQPGQDKKEDESPVKELLDTLLPSRQFQAWLQMATGCTIESHDLLARRFRRGLDYTLATGHEGKPRLEFNLGITPTSGWGDEDDEDEAAAEAEKTNGKSKRKGKGKVPAKVEEKEEPEEVGGHEVYMAGDEDGNDDAAIYKSSADDDNILFFQAAAWNKLTLVLRDGGTLRFVKYVSRKAKGDRWDVSATFEIEEQDDDDDDDDDDNDDDEESGAANSVSMEDDLEEEFKGFSDTPEAESD